MGTTQHSGKSRNATERIEDRASDGNVTVNELITMVNIALGNTQASACPRGVPSGAEVNVALIIQAVNNALSGCGG